VSECSCGVAAALECGVRLTERPSTTSQAGLLTSTSIATLDHYLYRPSHHVYRRAHPPRAFYPTHLVASIAIHATHRSTNTRIEGSFVGYLLSHGSLHDTSADQTLSPPCLSTAFWRGVLFCLPMNRHLPPSRSKKSRIIPTIPRVPTILVRHASNFTNDAQESFQLACYARQRQ
jgi:hypothetical protein